MSKLTDKQEAVNWPSVFSAMREWHQDLHANMTKEKFIELYVGRFKPSESKEDERLRK